MPYTRTKGSLAGAVLLALTTPVMANMGNTPSDHGLLPHDVATAQALSIFNTQTSSVYYNPARLAGDERSELTGSLFHADHELKAESLGGASPMDREGDTLNSTPSQQLMLGLKTDLTDLTTFRHRLYMGFLVGTEKYAQEMLAFNAETSEGGQFLRYDRQPLFLALGFGTQLWRGIDVGVGARVTLHNEAELFTVTNLQGDTENERIRVNAKPVPRPIAGVHIDMGDSFCSVQDCWLDGLDLALAYRGYSNTKTSIDAEAEIPGTVQNPGLPLMIEAIDSFQPAISTLGVRYTFAGGTTLGLTAEHQAWERLEEELEDDTVRDQANVRFRDIVIPRLGIAHELNDSITLKAGVAREESPLRDGHTPDVNFLDNDRIAVGLGASAVLHEVPFVAHPVRLDFGYQYQELEDRDFELTSTDPGDPQPYETVRASGQVHVFTGSITLKF